MRRILAIRKTLPRLLTKAEPLSVIHACQHQAQVTSTPKVVSCLALIQQIIQMAWENSIFQESREECVLINTHSYF